MRGMYIVRIGVSSIISRAHRQHAEINTSNFGDIKRVKLIGILSAIFREMNKTIVPEIYRNSSKRSNQSK